MEPPSAQDLFSGLLGPLRVRVRPWWFPAQELSDPLVFFLDARVADRIFGADRAIVPQMEWVSQALLSVHRVEPGELVEVSIFGRPRVQNRVKSVLSSLASWHLEHQFQRVRIKQLEDFLKFQASRPDTPNFLFKAPDS